MKVAFQNKTDFLRELELEKGQVKDKVLRAVIDYEPVKYAPNVFLVTVVAGVVIRGTLVELRQFCGDMLNLPERKNEAEQKAQRILQGVSIQAREMDLHVRGDMYQ